MTAPAYHQLLPFPTPLPESEEVKDLQRKDAGDPRIYDERQVVGGMPVYTG